MTTWSTRDLDAPPEPTQAPARRAHRGAWFTVTAFFTVIAIALAAGAVWFVTTDTEQQRYPSDWDPRVDDLVLFVEANRGLEFEHPVRIEFVSGDAWLDRVRLDGAEFTAEDRRDVDDQLRVWRALGFLEGDADLIAQNNELSATNVLAFYDPAAKRITVHAAASEDLSVRTRATLVHELTHALQDQHFDLERSIDEFSDSAYVAFRSLVEGDAMLVEDAWVERLPERARAEYDRAVAAESELVAELEESPVWPTLYGSPYALGPAFVSLLHDLGDRTLEDAFTDPPITDEHVLDPVSYVRGDAPNLVGTPKAPASAREIKEGELGALTWYLLLAERIDPRIAFTAVQGWGGDSFVSHSQAERTCIRIRYAGETDDDTRTMHLAIAAWIESLPTPFATVETAGHDLLVESCDPGASVALTTGKSGDALLLPVVYSSMVTAIIYDGVPLDVAECFASQLVASSTPDEWRAEVPSDDLLARAMALGLACSAPAPGGTP